MVRDYTPITKAALLAQVREVAGPVAEDAAARLFELGAKIGAREVPGHSAVSIRLSAPGMDYSGWLTLYVVSKAGTMYVNWLERWADAGASPQVADDFQRGLAEAIGVRQVRFRPHQYSRAVPLDLVAARLPAVESIVEATAATLKQQIAARLAQPA